MQSNQQPPRNQPAGNGYLYRVLADGARPFRYRGGVRSLLGVPDRDGVAVAFAAPLPPVGFRYIDRAFTAEPVQAPGFPPPAPPAQTRLATAAPIPEGFDPTVAAGAGDPPAAPVAEQPPPTTHQPLATHHGPPATNHQPPTTNHPLSIDAAPPAGALANRTPAGRSARAQPAGGDASVASTQETAPVPPTRIEIPGISAQPQLVPNLSLPDPSQQKQEEAIPQTAPEETAQGGVPHPAPPSSRPERDDLSRPPSRSVSPSTGDARADGAEEDGSPPAPIRMRRATAVRSAPVADDTAPGVEGQVAPRPVPSPLDHSGRAQWVGAADTRQTLRPAAASHQDAMAQIEHLRYVVGQLTSGLAAQSNRPDRESRAEEPAPTPPTPPAQPVVIVNRSANQPGAPRAFWERRHLHWARLRGLR